MNDHPQTLIDAVHYFSDLAVCNHYMRQIKWPDGEVECPHCAGTRCVERADKKRLRCKDCRKEFSYKTGTLMEDSPRPLSDWFVAIWCEANGINLSSHRLAAVLNVTQRTALFIQRRIRTAMHLTPQVARVK